MQGGLIPNMFPEGDTEGLYHTADATMWFFHALARYLARVPDETTLSLTAADTAATSCAITSRAANSASGSIRRTAC